MTSPTSTNDAEARRLECLRELMVLDTEREPFFDAITELASKVCGTPIALISLVDSDRQWFKAGVGLSGVSETPRDVAFCSHAIETDTLFEIPDASKDGRFADNPFVTGAPDVRFYAGAPLMLDNGAKVGTLCVIDYFARRLDDTQSAMLSSLANVVVSALTMRRDLITRTLSVRSQYEEKLARSEAQHRAMVEDQTEFVALADSDMTLSYVNPAFALQFGHLAEELIGMQVTQCVEPPDRARVQESLLGVLRTGHAVRADLRANDAFGNERWISWMLTLQRDAEGRAMVQAVGRDVTERHRTEEALRASQSFLARIGKVAGVGGWEVDIASGHVEWSSETRRIHEVADDYQPTLQEAIDYYAPQARPVIEKAVQAAIDTQIPWDLELPMVTAGGRHIWARAVGEVEMEHGKAVRIIGALQDITDRKLLEQAVADQELFVRQITDSLPVHVAYIDKDHRYKFANVPHCRRFGRDRLDVIGRTRTELLGDSYDAAMEARLDAVLSGVPQRFEIETMIDGVMHRIETQLTPDVDSAGAVRGTFATGIDITERAASERALRDLSERQHRHAATLRSITEAIPASVSVVGADLCYRFVNGAFERWRNQPTESLVGRSMKSVLGAVDFERSLPWVQRVLEGEQVRYEKSYASEAYEGSFRHVSVTYVPLLLDNGEVDGFVAVSQDLTQQKLEENRLQQLSQCDKLTGLLNRAGLDQYMDAMLRSTTCRDEQIGLLYIDLDHFKPVNDTHGHAVGDELLKLFARRLSRLVRPSDAVVRLGGDEFVIVLCGVHAAAGVCTVAEKVVAAGQSTFDIRGLRLSVGASVGFALGLDRCEGYAGLLRRADAMLYSAKHAGRGRLVGEGTDAVRQPPGVS